MRVNTRPCHNPSTLAVHSPIAYGSDSLSMFGVGHREWRSSNSDGSNYKWSSGHRDNRVWHTRKDAGHMDNYNEKYNNGRGRNGYRNQGRNQHNERRSHDYKRNQGKYHEDDYWDKDRNMDRFPTRYTHRYTEWGGEKDRGRNNGQRSYCRQMSKDWYPPGVVPYGSKREHNGQKYHDSDKSTSLAIETTLSYRYVNVYGYFRNSPTPLPLPLPTLSGQEIICIALPIVSCWWLFFIGRDPTSSLLVYLSQFT